MPACKASILLKSPENTPARIELLAPAGNLGSGIVAVNCGADAVYVGAQRFGAREKAGNSVKDIEALCRYAHQYWARVYVTINTLLTDDELPVARQLIEDLYQAGIDGLIIQDTGLLEMDLPPVPLIASTQMHNHTPERVAFLEKVGFSRAILARELTLEEIREIREQTAIELECFVHGALCVAYSGQCYLSYAIGGRSGNRGSCAQPCRRVYTLVDKNGSVVDADAYPLSLRDLNLSKHLENLILAGIGSFKIEGRLKAQPYVANIVSYYRKKLDEVLDAMNRRPASSGKSRIDFDPDPCRTFNRGYTTYFFSGRNREMASSKTPKSTGQQMGTVQRTGKEYFTLNLGGDAISAGDGICFFDRNDRLCGTTINRVVKDRIWPDRMEGIEEDVVIYRNLDHRFNRQLTRSSLERKIGVQLTLRDKNNGFALDIADEDGNTATYEMAAAKTPAKKAEMARETIFRQLTKLGGTPFVCTDLKIDTTQSLFIPVKELNAMRREVIGRLAAVREENRLKPSKKFKKNTTPFPEKALSYQGNVLNKKAEAFYRRHGVTAIEPAPESGLDMTGKTVMTSRYCILYQLGYCRRNKKSVSIAKPVCLIDEENHRFEIRTDCTNCRMEIIKR